LKPIVVVGLVEG